MQTILWAALSNTIIAALIGAVAAGGLPVFATAGFGARIVGDRAHQVGYAAHLCGADPEEHFSVCRAFGGADRARAERVFGRRKCFDCGET